MAEVLVRYVARMFDKDGAAYTAQACGGIAEDGLWEGWIEFIGDDRAVRTGRETEQPNRDALIYWAEGLTVAYLEGALARATATPRAAAPREVSASPRFKRPARHTAPRGLKPARAILDPFATFDQGEDLLRGQLNALSHDNLVAIVDDYALPVRGVDDMSARRLAEAIVESVRTRTEDVSASARPAPDRRPERGEEQRP
jgi:hypothetical protein